MKNRIPNRHHNSPSHVQPAPEHKRAVGPIAVKKGGRRWRPGQAENALPHTEADAKRAIDPEHVLVVKTESQITPEEQARRRKNAIKAWSLTGALAVGAIALTVMKFEHKTTSTVSAKDKAVAEREAILRGLPQQIVTVPENDPNWGADSAIQEVDPGVLSGPTSSEPLKIALEHIINSQSPLSNPNKGVFSPEQEYSVPVIPGQGPSHHPTQTSPRQ